MLRRCFWWLGQNGGRGQAVYFVMALLMNSWCGRRFVRLNPKTFVDEGQFVSLQPCIDPFYGHRAHVQGSRVQETSRGVLTAQRTSAADQHRTSDAEETQKLHHRGCGQANRAGHTSVRPARNLASGTAATYGDRPRQG
nr:hypothetical protein CFP56_63968 [Quercus suber]